MWYLLAEKENGALLKYTGIWMQDHAGYEGGAEGALGTAGGFILDGLPGALVGGTAGSISGYFINPIQGTMMRIEGEFIQHWAEQELKTLAEGGK